MTGTPQSVQIPAPDPASREGSEVVAQVAAALSAPDGSPRAELRVPTSGSTGQPRVVVLSARAVRASGEATATRLGGHGQWLLALPTTHVAGLQVVARSVLAGTTPQVMDLHDGFRSQAFAEASGRLTGARRFTSLVPTQAHRLVEDARTGSPAGLEALAGYDAVLLGGAAPAPALLAALATAGVRVVITYGMSETAGGCVYDGAPLDGVRVRIREGRIEISGPVLADGYADDAEATAQAFATDSAGCRWLSTNDVGVVVATDGADHLTILGRGDDMLITGGVNVAPAAVEALLTGALGITQACVVGLPDPEWGTSVVAVVTLAAGTEATPEGLLAQIRPYVTDILGTPAAPRHVVIVDELAQRGPGKIDRHRVTRVAARLLGRAGSTTHN
ncbi:O-succinylbenzoic acid--CoA ligase [Sanguibacter gelidistatuariae]|uniref:O-succinylbenzoic acid--CoA ligase n=1 Tax=Sanguibacter gelidistatuariae TaxID=1814289 RepID=A0A1G6X2G6_9MICO|nr:AMP-binding protein [Sanguibacter gelidistatuariae]SDD72249.1 O-succinylbenzoic acid--CoA ligase [Sanguibacter gelidistatuariae]